MAGGGRGGIVLSFHPLHAHRTPRQSAKQKNQSVLRPLRSVAVAQRRRMPSWPCESGRLWSSLPGRAGQYRVPAAVPECHARGPIKRVSAG